MTVVQTRDRCRICFSLLKDPYFHRSSSLFRSSICCQKHYHIYKYFKRNSATNTTPNSSPSTLVCFRDLIVRYLRTNLPRTAVDDPNQSHWICSDCSRTLLDIEHCGKYIRQQINDLKTKLKKSNRLLTSSISVTFQQKQQQTKINSVQRQRKQESSNSKPNTTADDDTKIESSYLNTNHCNEIEDEEEEDDEDIEDEIDEGDLEDEEESNKYVERPRSLLYNSHVDERIISSLDLSPTSSLSSSTTTSSSHCKTNCNCKEPIVLREKQQRNILRIETPPPTAGGLVNNNGSTFSSSEPARLLTIASTPSTNIRDEIGGNTMNLLDETNVSSDDATTIFNNNRLSSIRLAQMMSDSMYQRNDATPDESLLTNLPASFLANIQRNILFKILMGPFATTFAAQCYEQQQQQTSSLSHQNIATNVAISPTITEDLDHGNASSLSTSTVTTLNIVDNSLNGAQQVFEQKLRQGRKRKSHPIKNQKFLDATDNNTKGLNNNNLQHHGSNSGNISPMDEAHYQQQNQTDLRSRPHSAETITSVTPITLNVAATMTDNNSDETGNKSHKDDTSPQRTAIITPTERVQLQHQTVSLSSIMNMTHNNHDKPVELTVKNNHSTIQQVTPSQSKSFMSTDVHNLVMKSLSENNVNKFLGFTIPNKDTEHGEDLSDKTSNDSSGKLLSAASSPSLSRRPSKRPRQSSSSRSISASNKNNRINYTNSIEPGAVFVETLTTTNAHIKNEKHRHSLQNESLSPNNHDNTSATNRPQRKLDPRTCAECGKVLFNDKQHLLHCQSHAKNDKQCWICGSIDDDMKKHISTIHGNQKFTSVGFQCQHCDKVFPVFADLDLHLREHSKKKPFECPICSKRFGQQGNLSCHLRIHTGVKPFNCNSCGKAFRHSNSLRRHSRTVHSATRGLSISTSPLLVSSSSVNPITTSPHHTTSLLNRRHSSSSNKNTNILELSHRRLSTGLNVYSPPPLPSDPMSDVDTTSSSTGMASPGLLDSSSSSVRNTNEKSDVVGCTN